MSPAGSTTQTDTILRDIFTSVAVGLPASLLPEGTGGKSQGSQSKARVALATGYQYSDRPYNLSRVQTTVNLKVAVPIQAGQTGGGPLEMAVQLLSRFSRPLSLAALEAVELLYCGAQAVQPL